MRFLILSFVIALAGCIPKQDIIHRCYVFKDVGGKSTPLGLIQLPNEQSESLIQQLPKNEQSAFVCWYVSGENLIVAERKTTPVIYGYTFIKKNDAWLLLDYPAEILAMPGRRD